MAALSILTAVQGAKGNKDGFTILANDACSLVYSVIAIVEEKQREGRELPLDLAHDLQALLTQLKEIEEFARKQRNFFRRLVLSTTDSAKILDYRQMLNHSLTKFGLQSNITIRDGVSQIAERQEEIVATTNAVLEILHTYFEGARPQ